MLRIAFYDLDNTLYPATCGLMESINQRITMFVQHHLKLEAQAARKLRQQYYEQYGTTLAGLQQHYSDIDIEAYLEFIHAVELDAIQLENDLLYPTLQALPLQRIIFTNAPREYASQVLERLGISKLFEHLLDIRAYDFLAKPHQRAYEVALTTAGAHPEECVFFEDTPANLQPAKQLGMTTVLIKPQGELSHPHADFVFPDIVTATRSIHQVLETQQAYNTIPPVTSKIAPLT